MSERLCACAAAQSGYPATVTVVSVFPSQHATVLDLVDHPMWRFLSGEGSAISNHAAYYMYLPLTLAREAIYSFFFAFTDCNADPWGTPCYAFYVNCSRRCCCKGFTLPPYTCMTCRRQGKSMRTRGPLDRPHRICLVFGRCQCAHVLLHNPTTIHSMHRTQPLAKSTFLVIHRQGHQAFYSNLAVRHYVGTVERAAGEPGTF
ncbi:hypothetical protein GMOD_00006086 [Pyrenophora seminiperda CCB06]|uniref:Uncharacterized protein n=1 Tax=Pyrenophora seminiperda CCB06 TaxID=1302712 RepID=A0A3M7M4B1_9PLEO|nr:hypothetical protein GMOD_00006086 [Pyrenophora seminiperda CCB06]